MAGAPLTPAQLDQVRAIVTETLEALLRRLNVGRYITGTVTSVTGPDAEIEPDDAPGTFIYATVTNASDQVVAARVIVWCGVGGTAYVHGVIP